MQTTHEFVINRWSILKPRIRTRWRKITEDDLDHLSGSFDDLVNILRKRYGYGKEQAEIELALWLGELEGDEL